MHAVRLQSQCAWGLSQHSEGRNNLLRSARNVQVLYLTEAIDEVVATNLSKFGEHDLVDVTKEDLQLAEDEEDKAKVRSVHTVVAMSAATQGVWLLEQGKELLLGVPGVRSAAWMRTV